MAEFETAVAAPLEATRHDRTPQDVVDRLRDYAELGVDEYSFWIDDMLPHAARRRSLQLFVA